MLGDAERCHGAGEGTVPTGAMCRGGQGPERLRRETSVRRHQLRAPGGGRLCPSLSVYWVQLGAVDGGNEPRNGMGWEQGWGWGGVGMGWGWSGRANVAASPG